MDDPGFIALASVILLGGDPGAAKSMLAYDPAARVSTGSPLPGGPPRAPHVLVVHPEDHEPVVRERIAAAHGDPDRIDIQCQWSADDLLRTTPSDKAPRLTDAEKMLRDMLADATASGASQGKPQRPAPPDPGAWHQRTRGGRYPRPTMGASRDRTPRPPARPLGR